MCPLSCIMLDLHPASIGHWPNLPLTLDQKDWHRANRGQGRLPIWGVNFQYLFSLGWCHMRDESITSWWRHQMETFSALLAICAGNSPVPGEFPTQRPVMPSFDVYFNLHPNKRLSKQLWGWWFEMPLRPLWRRRNMFCCNQTAGTNIITVMSHDHPGISFHQQLKYFFMRLFKWTTKKISKHCVTGSL